MELTCVSTHVVAPIVEGQRVRPAGHRQVPVVHTRSPVHATAAVHVWSAPIDAVSQKVLLRVVSTQLPPQRRWPTGQRQTPAMHAWSSAHAKAAPQPLQLSWSVSVS